MALMPQAIKQQQPSGKTPASAARVDEQFFHNAWAASLGDARLGRDQGRQALAFMGDPFGRPEPGRGDP